MLTKNKKRPTRPWFCSTCDLYDQCDKKDFKKCMEETYQEIRDILDKDCLDDILDDLF